MRTRRLLALALVSVSGALGAAACAESPTPEVHVAGGAAIETSAPDDEPSFTPAEAQEDGLTGEAQEAQIALAARLTCQLVVVLIAEHVCHKAGYWESHCPEGTSLVVHDVKPSTATARVSCDTVKELTCGTGAFAIDRLARLIFCGRVF